MLRKKTLHTSESLGDQFMHSDVNGPNDEDHFLITCGFVHVTFFCYCHFEVGITGLFAVVFAVK